MHVPSHHQPVPHPPTHHLSAMPSRSRKRGRADAGDHVKDDGRPPKAACAEAGLAAGGEAAAATSSSPEDYSSMECWDKRYREGMFVEWYCGFDHVRPLFERFVPKVGMDARMFTKEVALFFSIAVPAKIDIRSRLQRFAALPEESSTYKREERMILGWAEQQSCGGPGRLELEPVGIHAMYTSYSSASIIFIGCRERTRQDENI